MNGGFNASLRRHSAGAGRVAAVAAAGAAGASGRHVRALSGGHSAVPDIATESPGPWGSATLLLPLPRCSSPPPGASAYGAENLLASPHHPAARTTAPCRPTPGAAAVAPVMHVAVVPAAPVPAAPALAKPSVNTLLDMQ